MKLYPKGSLQRRTHTLNDLNRKRHRGQLLSNFIPLLPQQGQGSAHSGCRPLGC